MSVTFSCPDAPTQSHEVECSTSWCAAGNRCEWCDSGIETVVTSEAPEINLAQGNAAVFLRLLGKEDWCGTIPHAEIPDAIRACIRVLNSDARLSACTSPTTVDGNIYDMGRTDEYVTRRLGDLMQLFEYAAQNGYDVVWS